MRFAMLAAALAVTSAMSPAAATVEIATDVTPWGNIYRIFCVNSVCTETNSYESIHVAPSIFIPDFVNGISGFDFTSAGGHVRMTGTVLDHGNGNLSGKDFTYAYSEPLTGCPINCDIELSNLYAPTFVVRQINPPPVPEPATWAMMLVGFGVTGAVLRRRNSLIVKFAV